MHLICKTMSPFYLRMLYAKFGLNWAISSGEEEYLYFAYFVNIFSLFRDYLPLKKGMVLPLNILESPSHKDELTSWFCMEKIHFLKLDFFVIIFPWKRAWFFISQT